MKTRVGILVALLLPLFTSPAFPYSITPWSYEDLFAKSDFVGYRIAADAVKATPTRESRSKTSARLFRSSDLTQNSRRCLSSKVRSEAALCSITTESLARRSQT